MSGSLRDLRNEEKHHLLLPKGGRGRFRELLVAEFEWQLKRCFTKAVVIRAGRQTRVVTRRTLIRNIMPMLVIFNTDVMNHRA